MTAAPARLHLRYRDDDSARELACSSELRFSLGAAGHLSLHLDGQLRLSPPPASSAAPSPNPVLSLGATYDVAL